MKKKLRELKRQLKVAAEMAGEIYQDAEEDLSDDMEYLACELTAMANDIDDYL